MQFFLFQKKSYLCVVKKNQMESKAIDKATSDKISFMTYIVPAFADAYKMNVQDALLADTSNNLYLKEWTEIYKLLINELKLNKEC